LTSSVLVSLDGRFWYQTQHLLKHFFIFYLHLSPYLWFWSTVEALE